ncbi:hypothetical protein ACHAWF_004292, partial [Thalassiosira exigua]
TRGCEHAYKKPWASNPALFDQVAKEIVARDHLGTFKPQELSNILLTYSKSGVQSSKLFDKVTNYVIGLDSLGEFKLQECSNIWYGRLRRLESLSQVRKVADPILGLSHLNFFNPQGLPNTVLAFAKAEGISNTVWAFTKVEMSHPRLFQKVADHILGLNHLNSFNSQELSNTIWVFPKAELEQLESFQATGAFQYSVGTGESNPSLFQKVADHIGGLNNFDSLVPQDLTNIVWAFAKAGESHPKLFHRVADHILSLDNLQSFDAKDAAQILWAYASANSVDLTLFKKVHDHLEANIDYASLDEDTQSAILRAYQKAEHASSKKQS